MQKLISHVKKLDGYYSKNMPLCNTIIMFIAFIVIPSAFGYLLYKTDGFKNSLSNPIINSKLLLCNEEVNTEISIKYGPGLCMERDTKFGIMHPFSLSYGFYLTCPNGNDTLHTKELKCTYLKTYKDGTKEIVKQKSISLNE
jgi:hypothetical protein